MKNTIYIIAICFAMGSCGKVSEPKQNEIDKELTISPQVAQAALPTSLNLYVFKTDNSYLQTYTGTTNSTTFKLPYGSSYTLCMSSSPINSFIGTRTNNVVFLTTTMDAQKAVGGTYPLEQSTNQNIFFGIYTTEVINSSTNATISGAELKRVEAQVTIRKYLPYSGATKAYVRAPKSYTKFDMFGNYGTPINATIGNEVTLTESVVANDITVRFLPTTQTSIEAKTFVLCVYYLYQSKWVEYPIVYNGAGAIEAGKNYIFEQSGAPLNFTPIIEESWPPEIAIN